MTYGVVYLVTNIENGKTYIGQTARSLERRWKEHVYASKNAIYPLHKAIKKYGEGNFTVELIDECSSQEELDRRECLLTERYNALAPNGYSLKAGEGRSSYSSEETRQKLSTAFSGVKNPSFGRTKEKSPLYGRKQSKETKEKKSKTLKGRFSGRNHSQFGKKQSEETIRKKVEKISRVWTVRSPEGEAITIINLKEFCRNNGLDPSNMSKLIKGKIFNNKGWRKC